jgi:hypothetical protein
MLKHHPLYCIETWYGKTTINNIQNKYYLVCFAWFVGRDQKFFQTTEQNFCQLIASDETSATSNATRLLSLDSIPKTITKITK